MSWDILIFNSDKSFDIEKGDEIPDFESLQLIIDHIKKVFSDVTWSSQAWGSLNNTNADIEFNLGDESCIGNNFMLHVRGGQDPVGEIIRMCSLNSWIAFDISGDQFLDNKKNGQDSFDKWEKYKDQVVSNSSEKKPWWKFW